MFHQFKTHILPIIEAVTSAVYHASQTHLNRLDGILKSFLFHFNVSDEEALLNFNLAPLCVRRDFAMLGLLHKCVLGIAHPDLQGLFPMQGDDDSSYKYDTRLQTKRHSKQLRESCFAYHSDHMRHSLFGLLKIYNLLDTSIVDSSNVKLFQRRLALKLKATCGSPNWKLLFSPRRFDP